MGLIAAWKGLNAAWKGLKSDHSDGALNRPLHRSSEHGHSPSKLGSTSGLYNQITNIRPLTVL